MMNIFLGSVYPKSLMDELTNRNQFVDYPANVFQLSLLSGLEKHYDDLRVVSSPVIRSSYSAVNDICKGKRFSHNESSDLKDVYVGTIPMSGLQMLVELWRVYCATKKLAKDSAVKPNLIIYALHSPFLLTGLLLRKKIKCSCVVVPDLPEFMSKQDNVLKKLGKKLDRAIINYCLKRLDSYALLSPYMCEKLPIKDKPWVLMEGIFDTDTIPVAKEKCEERVILYCGNLSRQYGIVELLNAFSEIEKDNYRLWICGRGDGASDVQRMAESDNRVKYLGVLSHDDVLKLQQQVTVLINPRSSTGEYTKYSFPSKTMEYLASGTPTIMCHLPAIPKEYDEHIFYIEKENAAGIKNKILEVCEKPQYELYEFGKKASVFIKNEKNACVQAKKIVDLINKVGLKKENKR